MPHETDRSPETRDTGLISRLSGYVADGLKYWEPRRLIYNAILGLVVVAHFISGWPASREKLSLDLLLGIFVLAVLTNVCYCVAYVADLFVQFSGLQGAWRVARPVVLVIGTAFAATIAHFFAKGMFPP